MSQHLALVALLVPDYQAGLDFFVTKLGWELLENSDHGNGKRWVRVAPAGAQTQFLLAQAIGDQRATIGKQGGGRVWLFLQTDDFDRDHRAFQNAGVVFDEAPRREPYGTVAVFTDPFGNRWDLIEYSTTQGTLSER